MSSAEQDTALQIRDLEAAGCERMYRDHGVSGTRASRPELKVQGLKPADIGRVIGVGRATVYRYLSLSSN